MATRRASPSLPEAPWQSTHVPLQSSLVHSDAIRSTSLQCYLQFLIVIGSYCYIVCILHTHCNVSFLFKYPNFALIRFITITIATGCITMLQCSSFMSLYILCVYLWLSFLVVLVVLLRSPMQPLYSLCRPLSPSLCMQYSQRSKGGPRGVLLL